MVCGCVHACKWGVSDIRSTNEFSNLMYLHLTDLGIVIYFLCFYSIIPMNYYGRNDIPLGEFLHRYCFRNVYICQSCSTDMDKHQRHFVHGRQEVRISMQQLAVAIPGADKNIFTWSSCLKCSQVSSITLCVYFKALDVNDNIIFP